MNITTILLFAFALSLSAMAAFYAVFGLIAIFAAAPIAVGIMGALLEGSKLVVASWLYRNWSQVPVLMRTYFTSTLLVLMMLTSMGIFGFLSRAHIEQKASGQDTAVMVGEFDRQIEIERAKIKDANTVVGQLDQVVQSLTDAQRIRGPNGSIAVRQSQSAERQQYNTIIQESNATIAKLQEQRLPLVQQQASLEAEVGPLKYVAAVIYGNDDGSTIEKAVRLVTILIVLVFDPLAMLMLIAANWSLMRERSVSESIVVDPAAKQRVKEVMKEVVKEAQQRQAEQPAAPPEPDPVPETPVASSWRSRPPAKG